MLPSLGNGVPPHDPRYPQSPSISYKVHIPNFATLSPLQLGARFISDFHRIDSMAPTDLYSDPGPDNYYFSPSGLGEFHRFEKAAHVDLPDRFFDEYNATAATSRIGMFPEIERAWIVSDNRIVLWNYTIKGLRNKDLKDDRTGEFLEIDQLKYAITALNLVKPRPGIFSKDISHLLVVATTQDMHIFVVKYNAGFNNVEIFSPKLSVSVQGLTVSTIVEHPETHEIYFTGNDTNIWRLDYTNKASFIKNRCDKVCLTKSGISSVIPSMGFAGTAASVVESVVQVQIAPDRNVLYTLSNKSVIRVYKMQSDQLVEASKLLPTQILKSSPNFSKLFEKFKIVAIQAISSKESAVSLIAVTSTGCRILLKLGSAWYASSLKLNVVSIKFPPSPDVPVVNAELDAFTRSKQHMTQVIQNQQQSQLLQNTKFAKIISPGVFVCVKKTNKGDKLFISIANYGFVKKNNKLVEDAEFIKYTDAEACIHDVIPLTPVMNATETPNGYANVLASQYSKKPLRLAILTNFGIVVYQYRTSDQILRTLNESTIENFIEENGYEETCSTLLYLACSYGHTELFKRKAQLLFSTCSNNPRLVSKAGHYLAQTESHPSVEDVVLSDRFYGTALLISRLFREFWNKKVFEENKPKDKDVKDSQDVLIRGLQIDRNQTEFFIGSVVILIEFFEENSNSILGLSAPNYSSDPTQFESEVCLRAEHIAFTSIIKSLHSIKEGLSFLMVLLEEARMIDIFKFLSAANQTSLLQLTFRDLLLPNQETKNLIKDLLSSIINKNILKGGSIDLIASSLQGRCGSFCSTDDVLIFKAIENLTRAKDIGNRDIELKNRCLRTSIALFEDASKSLTLENIENSINIMLDLGYYVGAVDLCLRLAKKSKDKKERDESKLYAFVFKILAKVDIEALSIADSNNQLKTNEILEVRDATYDTCFASDDKAFHYEFYTWFIDQGVSERLLDIKTPYILPFLEERSINSLKLSNLLWLFHAKREHYFDAASLLYALSISDFELSLSTRIEYLARANGFCNCVCPPNIRQRMIQLASVIQELFDVANLQMDILSEIHKDPRISPQNKKTASAALDFKVLPISDLFNLYTDPLGYYHLCLVIFGLSDYKNSDDILKRWELLFDKIYHVYASDKRNVAFYVLLDHEFTQVGSKLAANDLVFPMDELIKLVVRYVKRAVNEFGPQEKPHEGFYRELFKRCGVSKDKLDVVMGGYIEGKFEGWEELTSQKKAP